MPICDGCGADSPRITTTYNKQAQPIKTDSFCSLCRPEEFQEPFEVPSDRKVWLEAEAKPYLYQRIGDRVIARDELLADIEAEWQKDPDEEARAKAIAKKRATRRTKPLSALEIEQADRAWRPLVQEMKAVAEADDKQLENELNAIAEKYMRQAHEAAQ